MKQTNAHPNQITNQNITSLGEGGGVTYVSQLIRGQRRDGRAQFSQRGVTELRRGRIFGAYKVPLSSYKFGYQPIEIVVLEQRVS
jgi:hypothetical protein